jgi:hypothetical protein
VVYRGFIAPAYFVRLRLYDMQILFVCQLYARINRITNDLYEREHTKKGDWPLIGMGVIIFLAAVLPGPDAETFVKFELDK